MWIDWSNISIYKESHNLSILLTVVIIHPYTNNIYNGLWQLKERIGIDSERLERVFIYKVKSDGTLSLDLS